MLKNKCWYFYYREYESDKVVSDYNILCKIEKALNIKLNKNN